MPFYETIRRSFYSGFYCVLGCLLKGYYVLDCMFEGLRLMIFI